MADVSRNLISLKRIQRKRVRGWTKPENTIYVGRGSQYGNQAKINWNNTRKEAVLAHRNWLMSNNVPFLAQFLRPLRGHDLMCWCTEDQLCHADNLITLMALFENLHIFDKTEEEISSLYIVNETIGGSDTFANILWRTP